VDISTLTAPALAEFILFWGEFIDLNCTLMTYSWLNNHIVKKKVEL